VAAVELILFLVPMEEVLQDLGLAVAVVGVVVAVILQYS
jgi:hypothetical protein